MAGLISGPKAPRQPQIVYVPQASQPTPRSTTDRAQEANTYDQTTVNDSDQSQSGTADGDVIAQQKRAKNILSSGRGRIGTIKTGFRGILDEKDLTPRRKTLLGE